MVRKDLTGGSRRVYPHAVKKVIIGFILAAAAALLLILLGRSAGSLIPSFAEWVDRAGVWAPVIFTAGYAIATVAFVPGSLLTLAAGALFGLVEGVALVFVGAVVGSSSAFLISRHLARDRVARAVRGDARFDAIDSAIAEQGAKVVLLLRLSPVLPYNLLNYALGLTRVRFRDYVIASVGMIPGTLLYVYYGKVAGDLATALAGGSADHGTEYYIFLAIGLIATLAVTVLIARIARRALRSRAGEPIEAES